MSHFAKVEDGLVTQVIVAEQDFIDTLDGTWIQTSYNTRGGVHYDPETGEPSADQSKALRKNFAGIGHTYDTERDAFIPTSIFNSWVLNEDTCLWEAPLPEPEVTEENANGFYEWDDDLYQSDNTQGWVLRVPDE
jgi:hypothetical protein